MTDYRMNYCFTRSRDGHPRKFPFACPAAASFSLFGKRRSACGNEPRGDDRRKNEDRGERGREREVGRRPFLYSLGRDEGKKRAEKSDVELWEET